jgi:rare lipoprotein A
MSWHPGLVAVLVLLLSACSSKAPVVVDGYPDDPADIYDVPDAVPRAEPLSKYGNPRTYTVLGKTYKTLPSSDGFVERGPASFYGTKFHGRRTSSGVPYDMYAMTAAHTRLPLPTYVQVTNLENGRRVVVKVNDRGPFHGNRIIDLSYAAAVKLDIAEKGTGLVEVRAITPGKARSARTDSRERFFVQAGAFSERDNAESLGRKLGADHAEKVTIRRSMKKGQTLYRVWLGPLASVREADDLTVALRRSGIAGAHPVADMHSEDHDPPSN